MMTMAPLKRYVFFVLVLAVALSLSPAPPSDPTGKVEKLLDRLERATEIEKSEIHNKLSRSYWWKYQEREKILEHGEKALALARKFNLREQEIIALANMGLGYRMQNEYSRAQESAGKALEMADKLGDREAMLYCLRVLGDINMTIPRYGEAKKNYERMREIALELGDKKRVADYTDYIGVCEFKVGKLDHALGYATEALTLYRELKDTEKQVETIIYIGDLYSNMGNREAAMGRHLEAARISETGGMNEQTARAYQRIGHLYRDQENYTRALEFYEKARKLFKRHIRILVVLKDMGICYTSLGQYEKALVYLNKALHIKLKIDKTGRNGADEIMLHIGHVYYKKKDYSRARHYFEGALDFARQFGDYKIQADSHLNIGKICYMKGTTTGYREALDHFKKSLDILKSSGLKFHSMENYKYISWTYNALGRYEKALQNFMQYSSLKDQFYEQNSAKKMAEMQTRFETEKKEQEIELLKKNNQIQELKISRQRNARNLLFTGLMAVLLVMFYIVKKYRYLFTFWKKKNYIGHYKVVDKIASGGMGTIYKAHDIRERTRELAVKVLKEEYYSDETYKKRFRHEAAIIDQLDHPNIVKVIERGESDGRLYIAMELLRGRTLAEFLEEKERIELPTAVDIMTQVAGGLADIHRKNIIHRDLKPENIMIVPTPENPFHVKILDFGLSRTQSLSRLTHTGIIVGTIHYLSPEQVADSSISTASDIYSLGITFYQVLSGRQPFFGDSAMDVARQILETDPIRPSRFRADLPGDLEKLVMSMLARNPGQRPRAQDVHRFLQEFKAGSPARMSTP